MAHRSKECSSQTFCRKLGIRLIHSAVRHPQTNGKLERAFQDDMRDFYRQYDEWLLDHLRHDMPSYVHYRNEIRGHQALGGKPSITRLQEHTEKAPAHILAQLESYAVYELGRQKVNMDGAIRVLGRSAQLDESACGQEVTLYETLQGLEAKTQEGRWYLFPDYQRFRQLSFTAPWDMPASFSFEKQQGTTVRSLLSHSDSDPLHIFMMESDTRFTSRYESTNAPFHTEDEGLTALG